MPICLRAFIVPCCLVASSEGDFGELEEEGFGAEAGEVDVNLGVGAGGVDVGDSALAKALVDDGHAHGEFIGSVGGKFAARSRWRGVRW